MLSVQGQFNYSALFSQTFCTQLALPLPLPVSAAPLPACRSAHCCPCLWHTEHTALEKFFHFLVALAVCSSPRTSWLAGWQSWEKPGGKACRKLRWRSNGTLS